MKQDSRLLVAEILIAVAALIVMTVALARDFYDWNQCHPEPTPVVAPEQ